RLRARRALLPGREPRPHRDPRGPRGAARDLPPLGGRRADRVDPLEPAHRHPSHDGPARTMTGGAMQEVGVVGAGTMGSRMVVRLRDAGYRVVVHDVRRDAVRPLEGRGASFAASLEALAQRCRIVLSSLPGPAQVDDVHVDSGGLLAGARAGDIHVGLSTVSVDCARRAAKSAASRGVHYVDAPVSGGPMGVEAGTLAIMAAGDADAIASATPILRSFAARIFDLGREPGAGTLVKLVNNAIFLCSGLVHQEAVVLAERAGMDPAVLDEVLAASSASVYLGLAGPTLSKNWGSELFTLGLAEKDVALALESARSLAVPMPVVSAAHQHYLRGVAA